MSAEPPNNNLRDEELRDLWQDQRLEGGTMSLEEIRDKARKFEKKIRQRNLVEYIAAVIVFVSFGVEVFRAATSVGSIGAGLVISGLVSLNPF